MATVHLWPVIHARFIRIRPWKWKKHIAMRLEIYGDDTGDEDNPQLGRVVTKNTVEPQFKETIAKKLVNLDDDTPLIQADCKAVIQKAMDLAQCRSYGYVLLFIQ